jgi:hypothetical protein
MELALSFSEASVSEEEAYAQSSYDAEDAEDDTECISLMLAQKEASDAVCFQTASQKHLFQAFPEVILVDTMHGTNKNYYKLFSILEGDVFGKVM